MDTIMATAAAVTGARHLRAARNGQDAAAAWRGDRAAAVVVCDGCGSGASSEAGARLGAALAIRAIAARLAAGAPAGAIWDDVRRDLVARLRALELDAGAIRDHLLFTIVAAAVAGDDTAVWAIGDGAYDLAGSPHVLGPFADNAPPYLAYDLLDDPRPAHLAVRPRCSVVVATDGALELDASLASFAAPRLVAHPDALRRQLAVLARSEPRIDWDARRVVRAPAALQDDCAIGVVLA
jgi:protein phosphatase 2C-like protein